METLNNLGFCSSYKEVKNFESNAAVSRGTDIPGIVQDHFIQYIANNVDHNIRTIDGHDTFHGIGIIAGVTPGTNRSKPVPRRLVTSNDIAKVGRINIHIWKAKITGFSSMSNGEIENIPDVDIASNLQLPCKISRALKPQQPGWSGLMQLIHKGNHPGKSSVVFMPIVDMNPTDISCVYSTLKFVCDQAKNYNVTPIIIFDQPLWWKATILLCYHANLESQRIFFRPEPKQFTKRTEVWNIHNLKKDLGIKACECFSFGHAILGCDTTLSVFGVGKGTALNLITTDANFQKYAAESTKMEIEGAVQAT